MKWNDLETFTFGDIQVWPMIWQPSCLRVASVLPVGLPAMEN